MARHDVHGVGLDLNVTVAKARDGLHLRQLRGDLQRGGAHVLAQAPASLVGAPAHARPNDRLSLLHAAPRAPMRSGTTRRSRAAPTGL